MDNMTLEQRFEHEQAELRARQQAQRVAENDRISAEREAAEAEARKARDEALAAEAEAALEARLRNNYFAGSPNATEADWTKAWPKLRETAMLEAAQIDPTEVEVEALRAHVPAEMSSSPW